ncbi:chromosomal replication initiator protein DnaA [Branchiibius sp. NY16-3462-2]|uniref:chromosomal replication initiator protein DnaA n=1 Tax=Branchiibius sp. NY16-3462-2 TaxID=1807500 RepID=UPI0007973F96|nr:chromosomal replication initiator protein DnaA [Branchiibius sp. NY16-3462-2]KYH44202.1 chromosomal replication initiation protein DnaA [Branchiibius sp. NY16-3462-2]
MLDLADSGIPAKERGFLQIARLVGVLGDTALIAVPFDNTKTAVESTLAEPVRSSLSRAVGRDLTIAVTVDQSLRGAETGGDTGLEAGDNSIEALASTDEAPTLTLVDTYPEDPVAVSAPAAFDPAPPRGAAQPISQRPSTPGHGPATVSDRDDTRLNPKYTFDTFVIGAGNRFACAAAQAVAETPARSYNPLFIYGDSGLGKTHLLHAIGHYVRSYYPQSRVRYVNSEEFTNDFINSIRDDKASSFQKRYRDNVDVLLIDDVQFLQGKESTQEEFFHTFNALHNSEKQIVLTSDQPPKQLNGLEERMRSRFEWGLTTDVKPPDLETRIAILRKKAITDHIEISDDVLSLIADKVPSNIRELEGALIRVAAYGSVTQSQVDPALAAHVLKDLVPSASAGQVTAPLIMRETARYFGVTIDELCDASRSRTLVNARQVAMYLCRELTDLSLPKIGQYFGGRDHTTVMHADRKIRQLLPERHSLYDQISELTQIVRRAATSGNS